MEPMDQAYMEELARVNAALEDALKAAEEANQAKSRFLSSMSHDIRTPMNAIVGMTSIALSHIDEKARVQDCLRKIQTASSHLMSLVNDVLDMSRIDSGRMALSEEDFSLPDLVHEVAVIVGPQAAQKRQALHTDIGDIFEENLVGDPLRLRQILVNIIGNAVKYTQEEGEIRIHFTQRPAPDRKGGPAVWLDFSCQDNGIGMSQEFLTRIFLPFERVQNTTISKIEGTGLGMSIVKKLVDSMGGDITVESQEGVGSRFTVALPFSVSPLGRRELALPVGQAVLVAEPRDDRAGQIMTYLRDAGLEPIRLTRGVEAVTRLTEAQYENRMPCALLLGHELADMSPLDAATHVRQLAGSAFPILLVSEDDWAQIEYRAVRAGDQRLCPLPAVPQPPAGNPLFPHRRTGSPGTDPERRRGGLQRTPRSAGGGQRAQPGDRPGAAGHDRRPNGCGRGRRSSGGDVPKLPGGLVRDHSHGHPDARDERL